MTNSEQILDNDRNSIKTDSWNRALHACATAFIFEQRARRLRKRLKGLTFVALVVPVIVGGLVLAYGAGLPMLGVVVAVGAGVGLIQLIVSTWSVVAGWVESYDYAITSLVENQRLSRDFRELGEDEGSDVVALRNRLNILKASDDARQAQDYGQDISEEEKRMGHRAALRDRQRACVGCGQTPISMEATDCGVCGRFAMRKI